MTNTQTTLTVIIAILMFGFGFSLGKIADPEDGILSSLGKAHTASAIQKDAQSNTHDPSMSSDLSDDQRRLMTALGIDVDEVTITPEMIVCAEAKLGAQRIEAIKEGATPTVAEGLDLVACYR